MFSFDDGFSWTCAWVADGVEVDAGVCADDGVVTVGDDGTGVIIQPIFKNVVVPIEHETKGEVSISADGSAGPDVPATDGPVVLDDDESDVPFAWGDNTAWDDTTGGKVGPDAGGTEDGTVCGTDVAGFNVTGVTGGTVVAGGTVDGIFCTDVVSANVFCGTDVVTGGTIAGNDTFVGHSVCRGGEPPVTFYPDYSTKMLIETLLVESRYLLK